MWCIVVFFHFWFAKHEFFYSSIIFLSTLCLQVLGERKWKEVTAVFNFPSTATNASFVLRKYYYSLLKHYEQLYFFRSLGWASVSTGMLHWRWTLCCVNSFLDTWIIDSKYLQMLRQNQLQHPFHLYCQSVGKNHLIFKLRSRIQKTMLLKLKVFLALFINS